MDEGELRKKDDIGVKAKNLLENETLNKWWESAEKNLLKMYQAANISDTTRLIELKALMDAQRAMKADFTRYIADGASARSKLGNKPTLKEKILNVV